MSPTYFIQTIRQVTSVICLSHFYESFTSTNQSAKGKREADLSASIQHALGVPDAYIMQRGGWGSDAVLKQVYRHALSDQSEALNHVINDHFSNLCNTKYHTK